MGEPSTGSPLGASLPVTVFVIVAVAAVRHVGEGHAARIDTEDDLLSRCTEPILRELHHVAVVVAIPVHLEHGARHVLEAVRTEEVTALRHLLNDEEAREGVRIVVALVVVLHEIDEPSLGALVAPTVCLLHARDHLGEGVDEDRIVTCLESLLDGLLGHLGVVAQEQGVQTGELGEPAAVAVHVDPVHLTGHEEHPLVPVAGQATEEVEAHSGLTDTWAADHDYVGGGHEATLGGYETVQDVVARAHGHEQPIVELEVFYLDRLDLDFLLEHGGSRGGATIRPGSGCLFGVEHLLGDEALVLGYPISNLTTGLGVQELHVFQIHVLCYLVTG